MSQIEAAYDAQQRVTTAAWGAVRTAEANLFQADKKLNILVDHVETAQQVLSRQTTLDIERF